MGWVADNYDRLPYPPDAATRDSRYSRYVNAHRMLRAHTTAHVPDLLDQMAAKHSPELIVACPGICYRRDRIDRLHVGEPHQLDVWRIRAGGPALGEPDLLAMIGLVVGAALPGRRWRTVPSPHSYTHEGRQIDVYDVSGEAKAGSPTAWTASCSAIGFARRSASGLARSNRSS